MNIQVKEGDIELSKILDSNPQFKTIEPSEWHDDVIGKIINYDNTAYRIRVFSYLLISSDKEYEKLTFVDYLQKVELKNKKSMITCPAKNLEFHSFGSRGTVIRKQNLFYLGS